MSLAMLAMFFLSSLSFLALPVAAYFYISRSRADALNARLRELRDQTTTHGPLPLGDGDLGDFLVRITYGAMFGKGWYRQKELELMRAGFRGTGMVRMYGLLSLSFTVGLVLIAGVALLGQDLPMRLLGLAAALVLGYFLPDQILAQLRNRHRLELLAALPDTTDMLSIVLGAGLSMDQAIARVGDEIRFVYPELADEFYWMTLEVQAGQERAVAFQHMAQRTGLVDIRSLAGMIAQAERFGTGLSQALRIYADSLRSKRRLEIEANINRTAVKMVFPIVLFILPALFVVIVAPGIVTILQDLQMLSR